MSKSTAIIFRSPFIRLEISGRAAFLLLASALLIWSTSSAFADGAKRDRAPRSAKAAASSAQHSSAVKAGARAVRSARHAAPSGARVTAGVRASGSRASYRGAATYGAYGAPRPGTVYRPGLHGRSYGPSYGHSPHVRGLPYYAPYVVYVGDVVETSSVGIASQSVVYPASVSEPAASTAPPIYIVVQPPAAPAPVVQAPAEPLAPQPPAAKPEPKAKKPDGSGTVYFAIAPADAMVELDGRLLGTAAEIGGVDQPLDLRAGVHTLKVSHRDLGTRRLMFDVRAKRSMTVEIDLRLESRVSARVTTPDDLPLFQPGG